MTNAHATAAGHQHPCVLADIEDGGDPAVGHNLAVGSFERDHATFAAFASQELGAESFDSERAVACSTIGFLA